MPGRLVFLRGFILALVVVLCTIQPCPAGNSSGYTVVGRVTDAVTGRPLAFVNIVVNEGNRGGMTDIDGYFTIEHNEAISSMRLSYVGYKTREIIIQQEDGSLNIQLYPAAVDLAVVEVVAGENPAHRIIENVIREKDNNNPENISAFSYNSYNKFIFSGEIDVTGKEELSSSSDSIALRISEYLSQRHFFMMETVTSSKYRYPGRNNETVLASRVSGVNHPLFALYMSQVQSFSFYEDYIQILGDTYLSPVAPGSTRRYFFNLEDTTYTAASDTVFVISYRPSLGRNFKGLKGVLYINTRGWALQSVIAGPADSEGSSNVRIQQNYELISGDKWFPKQLNTDFEIADVPDFHGFKITGTGRTYIRDIETGLELRRRDFSSYHFEFSPGVTREDEAFWAGFRVDSLSAREYNTYHYIDSIAEEINLERQISTLEALFEGKWRRGIFDMDVGSFFRYNVQEGFRPGISFRTNDNLSRKLRFRGLVGYGFKDRELKYGGGLSVLLSNYRDLWLGYDYLYDTRERGGSFFIGNETLLSSSNLRSYYLETLDLVESHTFWLQMRAFRNYLTIRAFVSAEDYSQPDSYYYGQSVSPGPESSSNSRFFETGINLRFAYGERYIYTPYRTFRLGGNHPVIRLNISRGVDGSLGGEYEYIRLEGSADHTYRVRMLGRQRLKLRAGYFTGDAPWMKRFTAPGAYSRYGVSVPGSFATMGAAEFVSDRYIALFWTHSFEELLFGQGGFSPEIVLITNAAIGDLSDSHMHHNATFKTLKKGFLESGVAILNLLGPGLTSPGIEFMYRYGPYSRGRFMDNFSLRLSYSFLF